MKILITGGAGYLGTSIIEAFKGSANITCFDNLFYDQGTLVAKSMLHPSIKFYKEDINKWSPNLIRCIKEADIIIPLAALVGAPLCDKHPVLAVQTNYSWFKRLLQYLDSQIVIYPNTNSGYGTTGDDICTEETPSNPISLYAQTKQNTEDLLLENYSQAICFRLATVFGWSYRPRTDLLVNNLVKVAKEHGHISVFDGHFRRNYIHVQDIVDAFLFTLYEKHRMYGNVYNLGNDNINTTKQELVEKICNLLDATYSVDNSKTDPDKRDYIVSSQKLYDLGFECKRDLDYGIMQMDKFYNLLSESDVDRCRNY
tara:strand:- start:6560 stop:7498 length:939 start_codon:yes stop_codon:yes gene_type:complete